MKFLLMFIFAFNLSAQAHLNKSEVKTYLLSELENGNSDVSRALEAAKLSVKVKGATTRLIFDEPGFLVEQKMQTLLECEGDKCTLYERKFFQQVSSLRTDLQSYRNHSISIYFIEIVISSFEIWETDLQGQKKQRISEKIKVEGVYFL